MPQANARAYAAMLRRVAPDVVTARRAVLRNGDPEAVHTLRRALRRVRTLLALIAREAPSPAISDLRASAKAMATALGPVRALDVFIAETLPTARRGGIAIVLAGQLHEAAIAERSAALATARATLRTPRQQAFTRRLATAEPSMEQDAPAAIDNAIKQLHRRVLRLGRGFRRLDAAGLHKLRLAGKALADFAAMARPAGMVRGRCLRHLSRMTSAIGELRDREAAVALVKNVAGPAAAVAFDQALAKAGSPPRPRDHWRAFHRARPPRRKSRTAAVCTAAVLEE